MKKGICLFVMVLLLSFGCTVNDSDQEPPYMTGNIIELESHRGDVIVAEGLAEGEVISFDEAVEQGLKVAYVGFHTATFTISAMVARHLLYSV